MYVSFVSTSYTEQNWKFFEQLNKMYVGGALNGSQKSGCIKSGCWDAMHFHSLKMMFYRSRRCITIEQATQQAADFESKK